ncbi:MAG: hypothetical protein ACXAEU_00605 [Candidatus Hodarchaeales archaeon]
MNNAKITTAAIDRTIATTTSSISTGETILSSSRNEVVQLVVPTTLYI